MMKLITSKKMWYCLILVLAFILLLVYQKTPVPKGIFPVKDIRVTVDLLEDHETGLGESDITYIRIFYGYYSAGRWNDYPVEQYDLKSIFDTEIASGYDAAGQNHLVKIGPYLLISVSNFGYDKNGIPTKCEIKDSINSEVKKLFTEYYSNPRCNDSSPRYGYIIQQSTSGLFWNRNSAKGINSFGEHYYIILEYDKLSKDYELQYIYETQEGNEIRTLTYDQIKERIEQ